MKSKRMQKYGKQQDSDSSNQSIEAVTKTKSAASNTIMSQNAGQQDSLNDSSSTS